MSEEEVPPALEGETPAAEAPAAEEAVAEDIPVASLPVEKRKPKYFTHWQRPKSHIYEYNNDFRKNYYSHVVDYIDQRSNGYKPEIPKPQTWAERALRTFSEKKSLNEKKDVALMHDIRSNINSYTYHHKQYSRKLSSYTF